MKKLLFLSFCLLTPGFYMQGMEQNNEPSELPGVEFASFSPTDEATVNDVIIMIGEELNLKPVEKSRLRELVISGIAGSTAVALNNFSPASAFFAYAAWGASCKALMLTLPFPVKLGITLSLISAGAVLDKVIIPQFTGNHNMGFLPLGIAASIVLLKKSIKTPAKEQLKKEKKEKKEREKKNEKAKEV